MEIFYGNQCWIQASAFYLRMLVFVQEQKIHLQDEFDELDTEDTKYFVVFKESTPVATGRFQIESETILRPDRICVKKDYRKQKLGTYLIEEIEKKGRQLGCKISCVHGELSALRFYEKLNYQITSEPFLEDGILCVTFEKQLKP